MILRAQEPGIGKWVFPSGFLEISEHPEKAALRELYEETGIKAKLVSLLGVFEKTGMFYKSLLVVFYLVRAVGGRLRKSPETMDLGFFPPNQLKPIGFKTHRDVLKKYLELYPKGKPKNFQR
jgi:ADP-ribose pyrophosphatase YjhB (NUDIX family)